MSNPIIQIAETIQTASINRAPSPSHDLNPSTAASSKQPVTVSRPSISSSNEEDDEIPYSTIKPVRRKANLPPLPDLRFEQSYLASIRQAEEGGEWGKVGWITVRDQVFLPLIQGTLWTLALSGWRFWNRSARFSGKSAGSRIRRWWWEVNNWKIPEEGKGQGELAGEVGEVSAAATAESFGGWVWGFEG
ncbi:MAG: hypothetical protein M1812_002273 [Candelaria pacifica]|nr:MAG: hypothetical protein M1812_002273 [Candelaria pacifica]